MAKRSPQVQQIWMDTEAEIGAPLNEEIFQKALAKAKRWMKNAYGGAGGAADIQEYISERGNGSIAVYYKETAAQPDGRHTVNREMAASRPRET